MLTLLLFIAGIAVLAALGSYLWRMVTERDLENAQLTAEAEGYRGTANERRRRASQLAAEASRLSDEASEFDERARYEVEGARLSEERVIEAQDKLRQRRRFPRFGRR